MGIGVRVAGGVAVNKGIAVDVDVIDAIRVGVGDAVSSVGTIVVVNVGAGDSLLVTVITGLDVGENAAIVCAIAVPTAFGSTVGTPIAAHPEMASTRVETSNTFRIVFNIVPPFSKRQYSSCGNMGLFHVSAISRQER